MIIENHILRDFVKQDEDTVRKTLVALKYVKPAETKRKVFHLKLKHVEMIKNLIDSGRDEDLIKIVSKVQKCSKDEVLEIKIIEFFGILNSIKSQLETIVKAEENALSPTETNMKWELVEGSNRMKPFGIYNTLDELSKEDILKHKKIMNLKYSEVFTVLYKRKTAKDIQREMDAIKTK